CAIRQGFASPVAWASTSERALPQFSGRGSNHQQNGDWEREDQTMTRTGIAMWIVGMGLLAATGCGGEEPGSAGMQQAAQKNGNGTGTKDLSIAGAIIGNAPSQAQSPNLWLLWVAKN